MSDRKRIVCGTDFSIHAAEAAEVAALMAQRFDETLVLVHVEEQEKAAPGQGVSPERLQKAAAQLHAESERLRRFGVTVKEEVLTGSPYQALVDVASRPGTRMVVVSSLGQIAPSRFLVGSVAERTAESSPVPTLVVKNPVSFKAWLTGKRPLKIFVGDDFSATAEAALHWMNQLRRLGPCGVMVAHVNWPPEDRRRLGIGAPSDITENPIELQRVLERDLTRRVTDICGEGMAQVRVQPGWGRADAHLLALAEAEGADLIVAGTHQRHGVSRVWLGSVSRGILHHAAMNVAIVPKPLVNDSGFRRIPEFKRVLVATDFSKLGDDAVPYGYATLARGATVKLIHVIPRREPEPAKPRRGSKSAAETQSPRGISAALKRLGALVPREAEARGVITELEVVEDRDPARAITQEAERFGADLICIGSHGRSGLAKTFLGSVAQAIMAHSQRPVLVIRATR